MEPQLSQLHLPRLLHFHVAAKAGSLKQAARLLHLTPPALTRSLQNLEEELGVKLCQRSRAGLTLTDEGWRLFHTTSRIVGDLQTYLESGSQPESYTGILCIGFNDPVNVPSMDDALIALHERHPRCKLNMLVANSGELVQMVMSGELDLAVGYFDAPHSGLRRVVIGREPMRYYIGKRHPLAARQRIAERDLRNHGMVWIEGKHPSREELELHIFAQHPDRPMRATAFANHLGPARRLLLSGQAIVPMPRFWLADELRRGLVRELAIHPPLAELQTSCVYKPSPSPRPAVRLLLESLRLGVADAEPL
jgi:LysR family transcriptional regulator, transcriptional activator for bauABCD operon